MKPRSASVSERYTRGPLLTRSGHTAPARDDSDVSEARGLGAVDRSAFIFTRPLKAINSRPRLKASAWLYIKRGIDADKRD